MSYYFEGFLLGASALCGQEGSREGYAASHREGLRGLQVAVQTSLADECCQVRALFWVMKCQRFGAVGLENLEINFVLVCNCNKTGTFSLSTCVVIFPT